MERLIAYLRERPLRWWFALAVTLCGIGAAVVIYAGFLGELHPGFDTIAHMRLHLVAAMLFGALVLACFSGWRRAALAMAVLAAIPAALTLGPPGFPAATAVAAPGDLPRYRLIHLNLRYDNPETGKVLSMVGRHQPDVVSFAEVSDSWEPRLEPLRASYPYRLRCPSYTRNGGVLLISRRPFADGGKNGCHDRGSMALATIDFNGQAVDVASLYLGWPWPFGQDWQVGQVTPALRTMSDDALLAGDFNAAPWSLTGRRISQAGGLEFGAWVGPSFIRMAPDWARPIFGLPIDHFMSKGRIERVLQQRLPEVGSDHLPILLDFVIRPAPRQDEQPVQAAAIGTQHSRVSR